MNEFAVCLLIVAALALLAPVALAADYPPPAPLPDDAVPGRGIQRTMRLLASSTPQERHRVRILFYGQSITVQDWWREVADDLRRRFPHADLEIENRAIGGFASQMLVRTSEADLYPHYPDLVIFHVLGDHRRYEDIIRRLRERTTAEVAVWNDHVNWLPSGNAEADAAHMKGYEWGKWMSNEFIPGVCERYGAGFMDIRSEWRRYLADNGLEPSALLSDGVHLNDHGNFLLAELIKRRLVYNPDLPSDSDDTVRTYIVGEDVEWQDGRLRLEFEGNRVDLLSGRAPGTARVLIDGRKPSEFAELYVPARVSGTANIGWPAITCVGRQAPLLLEEWTVKVTGINDAADDFRFSVTGSVTGPDGEGQSKERFVSDSGRVVIESDDWVLAYDRQVSGKPTPDGFECHWRVVPYFVDEYEAPPVEDESREYATTLAQGLSNGPHVLELVAEGDVPSIGAIRIYRPPVR